MEEDKSCNFLEQLYFRSCALKCAKSSSTTDDAPTLAEMKDCVTGCQLARGKPLRAALLAFTLFGIEEETVFDSVMTEFEMKTVGGRLTSISNGINQGCHRECALYCKESSSCNLSCAKGCQNFVDPLTQQSS